MVSAARDFTPQVRHPLTYVTSAARPAPPAGPRALSIYSGSHSLTVLGRYQRVVVQPTHYRADAVRWLQARGVQVLAHLRLGAEDPAAEARLPGMPDWPLRPVDVRDPEWRARIEAQILGEKTIFNGFYLDHVDLAEDPVQVRAMLKLIRQVRQWAGPCYLLTNQGFRLLPRLGGCVNGVLINGLSTTWEDGYRVLDPAELEVTAARVAQARRLHLDAFGLDYAITTRARRFALRRAEQLGVPTFVSNRELSLPGGLLPRMALPERQSAPAQLSTA
ncbi:hypothetical protein [Deinococcus radiotolerans]|uniref:Glycoside-hydrolase family GH114 TIM-barrel domain-containing protein n=1 Tax=Deinococcus radiotolerans TaxID=1309407 RepID=A0ABQ2FJ19_9DEIO|nr:hypothetical protein [Deinococcus radiotolerans]GGK99656.1 hypothetical protein GCM10010844_17450 [Deinococcus radiotolerans]